MTPATIVGTVQGRRQAQGGRAERARPKQSHHPLPTSCSVIGGDGYHELHTDDESQFWHGRPGDRGKKLGEVIPSDLVRPDASATYKTIYTGRSGLPSAPLSQGPRDFGRARLVAQLR